MRLSIHSSELERVLEWVDNDDRRLADLTLEADGRFQTRRVRASQLGAEVAAVLRPAFQRRRPDAFPRLIYGAGRARGGSTSLANVFGVAGVPAYYQPLKSMLRHALTGARAKAWAPGGVECLFAKETFGPYSLAECLFLPVDVLLDAGYPTSRIHVILFDREPMAALASWLARWGSRVHEEVLVAHFLIATHNARRVARRARSAGVRVTHYVHELSKVPELGISRLFAVIGETRRFTPGCVHDWGALGDMAANRSGVIFPPEPDIFHVPGLHSADGSYRFRSGPLSDAASRYRGLLLAYGLDGLYRASVRQSMADLDIEPPVAARLFDDFSQ